MNLNGLQTEDSLHLEWSCSLFCSVVKRSRKNRKRGEQRSELVPLPMQPNCLTEGMILGSNPATALLCSEVLYVSYLALAKLMSTVYIHVCIVHAVL